MFTLSNHATGFDACHRPAHCLDDPTEDESVVTENEFALTDPSVTRNSDVADFIQKTKKVDNLDFLNTDLLDPDCEAVLEQMDSCVGCVNEVDEQHVYEEKLIENALHRKAAVEQHGLTEAEAALIRLHIMEEERDDHNKELHIESAIPDLDILNLCGNDDDLDDAQEVFMIPATQEVMSCADIVDEDLVLKPKENKEREARDGVAIGEEINALQCAICFDEALTGGSISLNRVKFANLPCCGNRLENSGASFIKVCTSCILVLTSPSSAGSHRIGRCPRCLSWIKVQLPEDSKDVVTVEKVDVSGPCLICNQDKDVLVEGDKICDSCFLGRRQPLKYECQQCHCIQRIPHPMYRYQKTPDMFGNVTWACQGKCGRFTKWKLENEELHRIPLGDAPKSWGPDADYIKVARDRVQILRQDLVGRDLETSLLPDDEEDPSQCLIL